MADDGRIKTIIIENETTDLQVLEGLLSNIPQIELVGTATQYRQAQNLLSSSVFDLVFISVEISGKSAFELINEIRLKKGERFSLIICAFDEKHVIRALRESAYDYILKPVLQNDLEVVVRRYLSTELTVNNNSHLEVPFGSRKQVNIITLPTLIGLQFVDKDSIALFLCRSEFTEKKPSWTAVLGNQNCIRLKSGITSKAIIRFIGHGHFLQVNQSTIINIHYISHIEFGSRSCFLHPPFNQSSYHISKSNFAEIKGRFDRL